MHVRCHVHRDGHWNWQDQAHFHRGLQEGTQGDEIIPRILAKTSQVPPTHLGSDIHGYWEPGFKDMTSQDVMWWHFTSLFPFIGWGLRFLMCNVGDCKTIHLTEYLYLCFFLCSCVFLFVNLYSCIWWFLGLDGIQKGVREKIHLTSDGVSNSIYLSLLASCDQVSNLYIMCFDFEAFCAFILNCIHQFLCDLILTEQL